MAAFTRFDSWTVIASCYMYAIHIAIAQSPVEDPQAPNVSQANEADDSIMQTMASPNDLLSAPSTMKEIVAISIGGFFLYLSMTFCILLCVKKNMDHIKRHLSVSKKMKLRNDESNDKANNSNSSKKHEAHNHNMNRYHIAKQENEPEEVEAAHNDVELVQPPPAQQIATKEDALISELKARQLQHKHKVDDNFIIQINERASTEQASPVDDDHETVPAPPAPPVVSVDYDDEVQHHAHILTTNGF
eukprot:CAMPEP_0197039418 /NCGR_PEP_ID=MMETSP1384-20130603/16207_1 /TAXON_ID=29189 /ORGANISM="Ammonia sp." /LENGTH=245 /DNA_ID=CAMNT_0042470011 /DNA_START=61 /DNA_END=798 /DNA_ORIENTATION=-